MSKTALLIIDVQSALVSDADRGADMLAAIVGLVARTRAAGAPIIYLQHTDPNYPPLMKGAPGWQIHPGIAPGPGESVIEKAASDGFYETGLQAELDRLGVKRLVICGLQTEFCVDATCRAALSRGFDVVLAADAHSTTDAVAPASLVVQHHNRALAHLAHPHRRIVVVASAEIAIA